ncbi:unnamed protein product [Lampetra fluviatilis]
MVPASAGSGDGVPALCEMAAKSPHPDSSAAPSFAVEGKDRILMRMEDDAWRSARRPCASLTSSSTEGKASRAPAAPYSAGSISAPSLAAVGGISSSLSSDTRTRTL